MTLLAVLEVSFKMRNFCKKTCKSQIRMGEKL